MKTQAVRMEEGMVALIETIAEAEGIKPADVHRSAVASYVAFMAEKHSRVAELLDDVINEEKARKDQEIDNKWQRVKL